MRSSRLKKFWASPIPSVQGYKNIKQKPAADNYKKYGTSRGFFVALCTVILLLTGPHLFTHWVLKELNQQLLTVSCVQQGIED